MKSTNKDYGFAQSIDVNLGRMYWRWIAGLAIACAVCLDVSAQAPRGPAVAADTLVADTSDGAVCASQVTNGPVFITEDCTDPVLNKPYVDVRRPGSIVDARSGQTVSYLYVHGGFTGTKAKFSFYFPAADKYQGRFFQTTYPTLGTEDAAEGCPAIGTSACSLAFALSHGGYAVSSNNAGGVPAGGALAAYRANAAAAKYSRVIAAEVYETKARPRGYIYGASGGGYQTVGSMENTRGVWDGGVPMVFGVPNAIPSFMTVQVLALRVLRDKLPQIADAMAPGGSGNPYAGLDTEQQEVLREVTRLGMPLRGWWQYRSLNGGGFYALGGVARAIDAGYGNDFWTKPGYEGSDPAVQAARIRTETKITAVNDKKLTLAAVPEGDLQFGDLVVASGPKAGQTMLIMGVSGNTVELAADSGLSPGTTVKLDNSWLLALQYFQRHQVPGNGQYGWDQYLGADGKPRLPQRPMLVGPMMNAQTAGSPASGQFHGKVIMVGSVMDVMAYPWSADWYRRQAATRGGKLSDSFRLWFMDNADHGPNLDSYEAGVGFGGTPGANNHIVGYLGEVEQALLDLDAWVVKGTPPPATTGYRIDADNQVQLEPAASERGGVQPVLGLTAKGPGRGAPGVKAVISSGQQVAFALTAQVPSQAGEIVKVEWDFEGTGTFAVLAVPPPAATVQVKAAHAFAQPGTYFPVVRVTSERQGNAKSPFGLVQNLASVRVVVR